jgi:hypothetical protein
MQRMAASGSREAAEADLELLRGFLEQLALEPVEPPLELELEEAPLALGPEEETSNGGSSSTAAPGSAAP